MVCKIKEIPGFTAHAGSNASIYIAPPDCNEMPLLALPSPMLSKGFKDIKNFKEIMLSFEPEFSENTLSIFPNPTYSTTTVQLRSKNSEISIISIQLFDILGRELLLQQVGRQSYSIDLSSYPKGIYFISVRDTDRSYYQKIIKQ